MYPDYCRDTFTTWVTEPREPDFSIDPAEAVAAVAKHRPTVTILTSPNNPTGTALPLDTAREVLAATAKYGGLVVVDEAYGEFRRPGTPSALELLGTEPRLIVTRTMSKAFAFAGTRLGYAVTSPEIVDALRLVRLPYHLSAVTQIVARTAIAHADELLAHGRPDARRARRASSSGCGRRGSRSPTATPTSCSSAVSTTATRCGSSCSTAAY